MTETSDPDDSSDDEDDAESVATMSAALSSASSGVTDLTAAREQRELRERKGFYCAMREGERVPSTELQGASPWMRLDALHDALAQTRRLSSAHLHYLLAVIARSHRPCGYVTADYNDATPPSLTDWSRWLRGVSKQNIYRIREELHTWRVISYVENDPMRVAINPVWETWDAAIFEAHEAHRGSGRLPARDTARDAKPTSRRNLARLRSTSQYATGEAQGKTFVISADYTASSQEITERNLSGLLSSSQEITDDTSEAAAIADSRTAPLTLNTLTLSSLDTLSSIHSAAVPAAPSPLAQDTPAPLAPNDEVDGVTANETPATSTAPAKEPAKAAKAPKPKPPRELSPDHQYRVDLLAAIEQANGGMKSPNRDREWAAAGKFFHRPAGAAPIEQVVACYTTERQRPKWDSEYLSLTALLSHFDPYLRNPAGYARAIERARAAADGMYDQPRDQRETRDERRDSGNNGGNGHAKTHQQRGIAAGADRGHAPGMASASGDGLNKWESWARDHGY